MSQQKRMSETVIGEKWLSSQFDPFTFENQETEYKRHSYLN